MKGPLLLLLKKEVQMHLFIKRFSYEQNPLFRLFLPIDPRRLVPIKPY
jgi:hypothetical protein